MRRTQLYLDEEMSRTLTAESRRRGTTVSALVREAVAAAYGRPEAADRHAVIQRIAGVWADRDDIGDTDAFVRGLRRSARLERWTRGTRAPVSARQRRDH
ncbi:MAG TPA: CopG family transcriptional regulator [Candidatus Acidoferrales bacterium]|nr:CopG family transcriptional regulator [Candidatus Acidoferrales bacterium]